MAIHKVKIWKQFTFDVATGKKPWDVRFNDRNYKVGDTLIQQEWDNEKQEYTGNELHGLITYILEGGQFGIQPGYVVMSFNLQQYRGAQYMKTLGTCRI